MISHANRPRANSVPKPVVAPTPPTSVRRGSSASMASPYLQKLSMTSRSKGSRRARSATPLTREGSLASAFEHNLAFTPADQGKTVEEAASSSEHASSSSSPLLASKFVEEKENPEQTPPTSSRKKEDKRSRGRPVIDKTSISVSARLPLSALISAYTEAHHPELTPRPPTDPFEAFEPLLHSLPGQGASSSPSTTTDIPDRPSSRSSSTRAASPLNHDMRRGSGASLLSKATRSNSIFSREDSASRLSSRKSSVSSPSVRPRRASTATRSLRTSTQAKTKGEPTLNTLATQAKAKMLPRPSTVGAELETSVRAVYLLQRWITNLPLRLRGKHFRSLRRKYSAIAIQSWWRRMLDRRRWKALWKARYVKEDAEIAEARVKLVEQYKAAYADVLAAAQRRTAGGAQFRNLQQLERSKCAVIIQTAWRRYQGAKAKELRYSRIVKVQSVARRWLANRKVGWARRFQFFRERRAQRKAWEALRSRINDGMESDLSAVMTFIATKREVAALDEAARQEREAFDEHWNRWNDRMTRAVLARPCGPEWVPQLDPVSGSTYYLNIETGVACAENPNLGAAMETREQERVTADTILAARLRTIHEYKSLIERGEIAHRRQKIHGSSRGQ